MELINVSALQLSLRLKMVAELACIILSDPRDFLQALLSIKRQFIAQFVHLCCFIGEHVPECFRLILKEFIFAFLKLLQWQ